MCLTSSCLCIILLTRWSFIFVLLWKIHYLLCQVGLVTLRAMKKQSILPESYQKASLVSRVGEGTASQLRMVSLCRSSLSLLMVLSERTTVRVLCLGIKARFENSSNVEVSYLRDVKIHMKFPLETFVMWYVWSRTRIWWRQLRLFTFWWMYLRKSNFYVEKKNSNGQLF